MFKKLISFLRKISFPVPLQMLTVAFCWGLIGFQIGGARGAEAQRIEDHRDYTLTYAVFEIYEDSTECGYPLILNTDYHYIGSGDFQQQDSIQAQKLFQGQKMHVVAFNDTLYPSKLVFKVKKLFHF